jgi:hypothetical protein
MYEKDARACFKTLLSNKRAKKITKIFFRTRFPDSKATPPECDSV